MLVLELWFTVCWFGFKVVLVVLIWFSLFVLLTLCILGLFWILWVTFDCCGLGIGLCCLLLAWGLCCCGFSWVGFEAFGFGFGVLVLFVCCLLIWFDVDFVVFLFDWFALCSYLYCLWCCFVLLVGFPLFCLFWIWLWFVGCVACRYLVEDLVLYCGGCWFVLGVVLVMLG